MMVHPEGGRDPKDYPSRYQGGVGKCVSPFLSSVFASREGNGWSDLFVTQRMLAITGFEAEVRPLLPLFDVSRFRVLTLLFSSHSSMERYPFPSFDRARVLSD